jgi:hypothetical protein
VGEAAAIGEERLARSALERSLYWRIASSTSWPLSGFLSSAVKSGTPFKKRTRSRHFSLFVP